MPTATAQEAALLAAVAADPEDTACRLVYADWLEERNTPGDAERAEFIRAQCEIMSWGPCPYAGPHVRSDFDCPECKRRALVRRRERELLDAHDYWDCLPAPSYPLVGGNPPRGANGRLFRRGFVEKVWLPSADWLAHGDAILREMPVREVTLTTWPEVEPMDEYEDPARPAHVRLKGVKGGGVMGSPYPNCLGDVDILLRARWPHVKFTLPPPAGITSGGIAQMMAALAAAPVQDHGTALVTLPTPGADPEGGFTVPPEFRMALAPTSRDARRLRKMRQARRRR